MRGSDRNPVMSVYESLNLESTLLVYQIKIAVASKKPVSQGGVYTISFYPQIPEINADESIFLGWGFAVLCFSV